MSGLEPMAAFGLACNVMQLISFTREVATMCLSVFRTGSADPDLASRVRSSSQVFQKLETSLSGVPKPFNDDEKQLLEITRQTLKATKYLESEVDKIATSPAKGKMVNAIKQGFRAKWRENKIKKLEDNMLYYQRILESQLLTRICAKSDALSLQQDQRFDHLDSSLQHFIAAVAQGETRSAQLVGQEGEATRAHITAETAQLRNALTDAISSQSVDAQRDLSQRMTEMSVSIEEKQQKQNQRERFIASLKFATMNERRNKIARSHERTCEWIFGHRDTTSGSNESVGHSMSCCHGRHETACWDCFPCWLLSPESKLYWVSGKPGSGKSTLMKIIATDDRTRQYLDAGAAEAVILSHFIWNSGLLIQRSVRGVLFTLLHQLVTSDEELLDHVIQEMRSVQNARDYHDDWASEDLERAITFALSSYKRSICVFLDGLDEIGKEDSPEQLLDLVLRLSSYPRVKICVSSRPEQVFKRRLAGLPSLRMQDLTRSDIERYIKDKMRLQTQLIDWQLDVLISRILQKAEGVFLWVILVVKNVLTGISNEDTMDNLEYRLDTLPNDLRLLYQQMWYRLNDDEIIYRQEAAELVSLVLEWGTLQRYSQLAVHRPVTILHLMEVAYPEIRTGVGTGVSTLLETELVSSCQKAAKRLETRTVGLLEVDNQSGEVAFIHRSVVEFFRGSEEGRKILGFTKSTPEERISTLRKAELGRVRLKVSNSVLSKPKLSLEGPFNSILHGVLDEALSARTFAEDIHRLYLGGRIPLDIMLDLLAQCKVVYDETAWSPYFEGSDTSSLSPRNLPLKLTPHRPDFIFLAASLGILDFISPLVQRLCDQKHFKEPGWADAYLCHLLAGVCFVAYVTPKEHILEARSRTITWLVECLAAAGVKFTKVAPFMVTYTAGCWPRGLVPLWTPAMTLASTAMMRHSNLTLTSSDFEVFRASISQGLSVRDTDGVVIVEVSPTGLVAINSNWATPETPFTTVTERSGLLIRVNLAFLILLNIYASDAETRNSPLVEGLADELKTSGRPMTGTILAYRIGARGIDSSVGRLRKPPSDMDSDIVLKSLYAAIHPDKLLKLTVGFTDCKLLFSGNLEIDRRLRQIDARGSNVDLEEIKKMMVDQGMMIREEDVGKWLPRLDDLDEV